MRKWIALLGLLTVSDAFAAQNEVINVERVVTEELNLAFPNDKNIYANSSDFKISNYVMMSNDKGERWAVLTLSNTSRGSRTLESSHLLATFADGERRSPQEFKLNFQGGETQSITVTFGEYQFPILAINTES